MGRNTRAGKFGSINTDKLKEDGYGFGVFAYYTGKLTYGQQQGKVYTGEGTSYASNEKEPDFMYNQKVYWDAANYPEASGYITSWTYSPLKYWPNEVQSGTSAGNGVDDQENDADNNNATTTYTKGGNLTFFAYAPYVELPLTSMTDGIIAINETTELSVTDKGNQKKGDPTITYVVSKEGKNIVDLLWGTYGTTSGNVKDVTTQNHNLGVSFKHDADDKTYQKSILPHWITAGPHTTPATTDYNGYKLNADLTKQKTNGTVGFAFKHALAKVGGSQVNPGTGTNPNNGLLIVLDLDDLKGAETGGDKEDATKVTVKSIKIQAKALYDADKDGTLGDGEYLKKQQGTLNLATGQWDVLHEASNLGGKDAAAKTDHNIYEESKSAADKAATLNEQIAEPTTAVSAWSNLDSKSGVLTTRQNVYKEETNPLVFIPQTYPELTVEVDYFVRTKDDNLYKGYSEVEQIITKKVTFEQPVELNKQYSLVMHLGLTSVKFTAVVSDWEIDGDTDGDGTIETGEEVKITDVYVPRNVSETKSLTWSASGSNTGDDAITVAGEETSYTIHLTGLTESTAYTTAVTAGDGTLSTGTGFSTGAGVTTQDIVLTMGANTTTTNKTHTFTVTNGSDTYTVNITQNAGKLLVKATTTSWDGTAIAADTDPVWTITDAAGNAVTDATFGATGGDITLNTSTGKVASAVAANTTTKNKVTKVTVTKGDATGTVNLIHKAGELAVGSASKASDIAKAGETITISDVKVGGTELAVGTYNIVITLEGGSSMTGTISSAGKLSIAIPENTTGAAKTYKITKIRIDDTEATLGTAIELSQLAS